MKNNWHSLSVDSVLNDLKTNFDGLSSEEADIRLKRDGLNKIKEKKRKNIFYRLLEQFKDFSIIVLIIAAIVSGVIGVLEGEGIVDSVVIMIVVFVNALIGIIQESKAEKSLESLQKLSDHFVKVIRDDKVVVVPSVQLVVGDVVEIETGDYIAADLRLIESVNLKAQGSALTGESVPVEKDLNIYDENTSLADRKNMLFSTELITYGRGKGIVVATGMNTEVGKIANMLHSETEEKTPLQIKLDKVGKTLGAVAIFICLIIFVVGVLSGKDKIDMFMTAVSLAVAAIPEGLVAVSTIVLAIGVQKMVKKNAIIKKLPAVETLGSTTIICSDKTGTLTQNKMTVKMAFCDGNMVSVDTINKSDSFMHILIASLLCNDSKILDDGVLVGDPTETALVFLVRNCVSDYEKYYDFVRVGEIPFDSERKLMTTVNKISDNKYIVYTKGAIDELLKRCSLYLVNGEYFGLDDNKNIIEKYNNDMASNALRVLGFAFKELDHLPTKDEMALIENNLIFVGMLGMIDPPRDEVKDAVMKCKNAGIKTIMITGDHKVTAITIAKQLGILVNDSEAILGSELDSISDDELANTVSRYSVYARVSPEHKVRIVKAWQANGQIVAMTGDGVNDSPALKKANIGCAMGVVGTEVAKEASDLILTDDNFTTIVSAVEEGRKIYDNILKVIQFLISSNVGEVTALLLSTIFTSVIASKFGIVDSSTISILLPIHILWINLVTDTLPALSLAFDPASNDIMEKRNIKSTNGVFTKGMVYRIVYQGVMIGLITIASFLIGVSVTDTAIDGLTMDESKVKIGQTMVFVTLTLVELVHVFNVRNNKKTIFGKSLFSNKMLLLAVFVSLLLILCIVFIPFLREIFGLAILGMKHYIYIVILVFIPVVIVELFKLFRINTIEE